MRNRPGRSFGGRFARDEIFNRGVQLGATFLQGLLNIQLKKSPEDRFLVG